jgi:hypothetical protein
VGDATEWKDSADPGSDSGITPALSSKVPPPPVEHCEPVCPLERSEIARLGRPSEERSPSSVRKGRTPR